MKEDLQTWATNQNLLSGKWQMAENNCIFREAFKKKRNKKCGFFPHWGGVECSTVKSDLIDVQIHMLKPPVGNYPNILSKFYPDLPWFHVCQVSVGRDSPLEVLFTIFPVTVLILQQISAGPVRLLKANIFSVCQ